MPYGEAIVSRGLEVRDAINGLGLVSFGLLWQKFDIWLDTQVVAPLTTVWSAAAGSSVSTTWTAAAGASITTTWTSSYLNLG